jgi:hypothetical protein
MIVKFDERSDWGVAKRTANQGLGLLGDPQLSDVQKPNMIRA